MIANSPKAREISDSFLLGRLAARVYPHASVGRLYVLADWMSAYFVLDDVLDDTVKARDPEVDTEIADQFIAAFLGIVPRTVPRREFDVLAMSRIREGPAGMWVRTCPGMTAAWTNRLVHDMTDYLYSHVRQSEINSSETPFDEGAYCAHWPLPSALYASADLIGVATARPVPEHLIRNPDAATMREAASYVVAWVNDLYSAHKQICLNDLCNSVVVLTSKLDVSLQEAADLVAQRVDVQVGRFLAAESRAEAVLYLHLQSDDRQARTEMVEGRKTWITGNALRAAETASYTDRATRRPALCRTSPHSSDDPGSNRGTSPAQNLRRPCPAPPRRPHDGQRGTRQCRSTPVSAKPRAPGAHRVEPAGSRDPPPWIRHRALLPATGPVHPASPLHPPHRRPESGQL
ncbi:hypothetical protein [Streptomyces sp. OspMP-M43]|uniref:terpene synthase family protein n=1 Tax=Streptomyces sp. OspMP-M43 TaxID=1839781 RepID=UPI00081BA5C2|nr:hypothetical protein [Streptomyces sp. OspMP-M43]SCE56935.1 hypothetical protein GA0115261_108133 [Streptomyces sp. OspMP-M43]